MYKRIVIITKTGFKLYGDRYKVDDISPVLYPDYSPRNTLQDYEELEKAMMKYRLNIDGFERWYCEELQ